MSKVSIIVPVYNVEKYIGRSIESILSQTFTNFELILVDDGSSDNSGFICDEYAKKDSRIRVIHKENGGVSSARNMGLDFANGEYILFVDSDDYLSLDTFACLINIASSDKSIDLIDYPYVCTATSVKAEKLVASSKDVKISGKKNILNYWFYNPRFEAASRLYKRSIISELRFPVELKVGEDTSFFLRYLDRCNTIYATCKGLYYYYTRLDSVMNSLNKESIVSTDMKMLENFKKVGISNSDIYPLLLYRVLMSKIVANGFSYKEMKPYEELLHNTSFRQIIRSFYPCKVLLVLLFVKLFGFRVLCLGNQHK